MKLLLDTHLLLWAAAQPDRLPVAARELIDDPQNEPIFSSASLWEVAIKHGLGRSDFRVDARLLRRGLLDNGYASCRSPANTPSRSTICRQYTRIRSTAF